MAETPQDKTEQTNDEHRLYEVGYHVVPTVGEDGLTDVVGAVRSAIEENGGRVVNESWPESFQLSYPMQKDIGRTRHTFETSFFGWMHFEGAPEVAVLLKTALDANDATLRFLIIKTVRDVPSRRRPVIARSEGDDAEDATEGRAAETGMTAEEMDKEIEKLVVE